MSYWRGRWTCLNIVPAQRSQNGVTLLMLHLRNSDKKSKVYIMHVENKFKVPTNIMGNSFEEIEDKDDGKIIVQKDLV